MPQKAAGRQHKRQVPQQFGSERMIRKRGFLIGAAFFLVACASNDKRAAMTAACIDTLAYADAHNSTAEAAPSGRFCAPKIYYLSTTVIYRRADANQSGTHVVITPSGKLQKAEGAKTAQLVIRKDSSGKLFGRPEKQNGKYRLKTGFNNLILEFEEGDNGFFYLITPSVTYCGYNYLRDSAAPCTLQYREDASQTAARTGN